MLFSEWDIPTGGLSGKGEGRQARAHKIAKIRKLSFIGVKCTWKESGLLYLSFLSVSQQFLGLKLP